MRYLGSKDSLIDYIISVLRDNNLLQRNLRFFDAFCGMGSVADSMKMFYDSIIINDSLNCASVFTQGRLYANDCKFQYLGFSPFDFLNSNKTTYSGFIYNNYSPANSSRMYFTAENAGRIDYFRKTIEEWYTTNKITVKEYTYLLACLLESVSDVSNTAGVYGAFLKHWDSRALKPIVFSKIDSGIHPATNVLSYTDKIENIIADVDCDILYLDPPYTQNQYGTQYHLLETIILNDNPPISAITGSRPTAPMRSDWSKMYHSHILFNKVIAETKAKYILFSYNNDGFMSKDYIEAILKRYGKVETYNCISIEYKKYNNTKCQGADGHCEYLFYVEKKPINDVVFESPLNYTGSKSKMMGYIKSNMPKNGYDRFIDLFGGGFNVGINIGHGTNIEIMYNDINPFICGLISSFSEDSYKYLQYINRLIKKYQLAPESKEGYLSLREKYNSIDIESRDPKMLYTLILYGFQQQIRFNTQWGFNNPVGSRWFNEQLLAKFISFSGCIQNKKITFKNKSFEKLLNDITPTTFIYADPPYRSTLGVYNDGKRGFEGWTIEHEQKLCNILSQADCIGARFMLSYVIEVEGFHNYDIEQWANDHNFNIIHIEEKQGRYNNRNEVIITNYKL
jgi:adenine-specific DNA-methyltransferase